MSSSPREQSRSRSRSPSTSDDASMPTRKVQRKERKKYSCEECRRLKLKCDREFPCQNCTKRGCRNICPGGVRAAVRSARKPAPLSARERELERLLAENGISVPNTLRTGTPTRRAARASGSVSRTPAISDERTRGDRSASPNITASTVPADLPIPDMELEMEMDLANPGPSMGLDMAGGMHSLPEPEPQLPGPQSVTSVSASLPSLGPAPQVHPEAAFLFDEDPHTSGTLMITADGRSKYLGPRAGNEWLKDQEIDEPDETPAATRQPSPNTEDKDEGSAALDRASHSFPFGSSRRSRGVSIANLRKRLPIESQGRALVDSYFRYFAWSYPIVPKDKLRALIDKVYAPETGKGHGLSPDTALLFVHQLALVFTVMAMGALHHLELQPDDPMAEEFLAAARACLTKGNFLIINTVPALQCLHLMAHVHLETEHGRNGDTAWPLWGLAMRMIQAMGIHRDGVRWNLPEEDIEERRIVFWNMQAADTFQANCFSRPNSIQGRYCDVQFPYDARLAESNGEERGYHTIKYQIAQLSADVLDQTLDLSTPTMDAVMALHTRIIDFEKAIPYRLRCRAAYLALPSMFSSADEAIQNSPEVDRWDLELTLHQYNIPFLISEQLINLHRPYFVRALKSRPADPVRSPWGQSFLVVIERSNIMISIAAGLHTLHPNVCARHWFLWFHSFNCAVTMGTVILADPYSELAPFCLAQMDLVISVYSTLVLNRSSPRMSQNLRWLMRLRQRCVDQLERLAEGGGGGAGPGPVDASSSGASKEVGAGLPGDMGPTGIPPRPPAPTPSEHEDELLGWRTRLIERTSKGVRRATTISRRGIGSETGGALGNMFSPAASTSGLTNLTTPSPNTRLDQHIATALDQLLAGPSTDRPLPAERGNLDELYTSTDQMLHNFWDPTTILGVTGETGGMSSVGWWDLEFPQQSPAV